MAGANRTGDRRPTARLHRVRRIWRDSTRDPMRTPLPMAPVSRQLVASQERTGGAQIQTILPEINLHRLGWPSAIARNSHFTAPDSAATHQAGPCREVPGKLELRRSRGSHIRPVRSGGLRHGTRCIGPLIHKVRRISDLEQP